MIWHSSNNSYSLISGKKIYKFKTSNKNVHFHSQFSNGSICNKFDNVESKEVSLNRNVFDFSVDYNAIDKCNILNIHKHLMIKNTT